MDVLTLVDVSITLSVKKSMGNWYLKQIRIFINIKKIRVLSISWIIQEQVKDASRKCIY